MIQNTKEKNSKYRNYRSSTVKNTHFCCGQPFIPIVTSNARVWSMIFIGIEVLHAMLRRTTHTKKPHTGIKKHSSFTFRKENKHPFKNTFSILIYSS